MARDQGQARGSDRQALARASPKSGERRSLRKISAELAAAGHVNKQGKPFQAQSIQRMIDGKCPDPTARVLQRAAFGA